MKKNADAFGRALWDAHERRHAWHVIERADGRVDAMDAAVYLQEPRLWAEQERRGLRLARGRVLDVGCGAGRHALYLQGRGLKVVGIDASPLAIKTARARGLKEGRVLGIERVTPRLGIFDTVLLLGNNFGLLANARRAKILLRRLHKATSPSARIIAGSLDVYGTSDAGHLAYQRENRRRGRMSGQIRMRARYLNMATSYFDYLMVSEKEMREIVAGTGWRIERVIPSGGASYVAVLAKAGPQK